MSVHVYSKTQGKVQIIKTDIYMYCVQVMISLYRYKLTVIVVG